MKPELNKWQWGISLEKCPPWRRGFDPRFRMWCLSFTSLPEEGVAFSKENFKGIFWELESSKLFIVTYRTFLMPLRLRIFLAILHIETCQVYRFPVWISIK